MEVPSEKPLSGAAKAALFAGACGAISLFYLFAISSVVCLLLLILVEFVVFVVALRVGAGALLLPILQQHIGLVAVFFRSMRLRKGADFHLLLQPVDAPKLFSILEKLTGRLQIAVPNSVIVEMTPGAWVRMEGYRRGAGKTILGVGYDLLAGLTQAEAEAVLAHEMAHAKLVQRGLKGWLGRGLVRVSSLTRALSVQVAAYRRAKRSFNVGPAFLSVADYLTRLAARQVAALSRQDEFEADRGAAELCGSAAIRSALLKVRKLGAIAGRLSWRERVAQLQLEEGFSVWLARELVEGESFQAEESPELFNKYSTHPSLKDRLAALPADSGEMPGSPEPAIQLLAEPDKIAEKLVVEIHRVATEQEKKDSKNLQRQTRRFHSSAHIRPLQLLALIVGVIGAILLIPGFFAGNGPHVIEIVPLALIAGVALIVASVFIYRAGRFRNRTQMPIPDFAAMKAVWQAKKENKDIGQIQKDIEAELRSRFAAEKSKRKKSRLAEAESYAALGRCEYLRAHVAGRLSREFNKKSVDGALAILVASGGLRQGNQYAWGIRAVRQATAMYGDSTVWAVGWAAFLISDWGTAEAFLEKALKTRPGEPAIHALLAITQWNRGKLRSAIANARAACSLAPRNREYQKLLVDLLLDGGEPRAASEGLASLESDARTDNEIMFAMVRAKLMQRDIAGAQEWTTLLAANTSANTDQGQRFVRLAIAYETARRRDTAAEYYRQALTAGFYPEAHLGLGRLAIQQKNKDEARKHFLAALDTKATLGEGAVGPLPLFRRTMSQILMLEEPRLDCRAWIAKFAPNAQPPGLAKRSLFICAPSREHAEKILANVIAAMQPATPPAMPGTISWSEARKQQQPDGPCRPGVHAVLE